MARTLRKGAQEVARTLRKGAQEVARSLIKGAQEVARSLRKGAQEVARSLRKGAQEVARSLRKGAQEVARSPMQRALDQARNAGLRGEVPVGAVITAPDGSVLAEAGNATEATHDASAHAELLAMRQAAARLGNTRLTGCDLWVTLEPCAMCAAAAVHFRVRRVVFGAYDPKGGGVDHGVRVFSAPGCLHVPEVTGGVREVECGALLRGFFEGLRR